MKEPNIAKIAEHYATIIAEVGADLNSEGLRETPMRAAKAPVEMREGSRMGTEKFTTMFEAECLHAVCHEPERLPVVAPDGRLPGSVAKNDLLLTVDERLRRRNPSTAPIGR